MSDLEGSKEHCSSSLGKWSSSLHQQYCSAIHQLVDEQTHHEHEQRHDHEDEHWAWGQGASQSSKNSMIALITILPSLANKRVQCNVGEPLAVGKCNEAVTVIREVTTITDNHTEAQKMGRCVNDLAQCNMMVSLIGDEP